MRQNQFSTLIDSLGLVRNATPEMLTQIAEWAVERDLWPDRREDVLARLAGHAQQGAQVYIASSVFEPTVAAVPRSKWEKRIVGISVRL